MSCNVDSFLRPSNTQKRPTNTQKRPTNPQKRPTNTSLTAF